MVCSNVNFSHSVVENAPVGVSNGISELRWVVARPSFFEGIGVGERDII